jgi:predicted nuclease of predicted toxin-antitoxin system
VIRFLTDQNFNNKIVRGAGLLEPKLDIICIQDTEADGANDPEVLAWAARQNRVVLTHDRKTMPNFAKLRASAGERMPGVVVVDDWLGIGLAIDDLLLIAECSDPEELQGRVIYVPI